MTRPYEQAATYYQQNAAIERELEAYARQVADLTHRDWSTIHTGWVMQARAQEQHHQQRGRQTA